MEFKIVVSDPKSKKSYQQEIKDDKAKKFINLKIGSELDGSVLGLVGYKLEITGGSDKGGFPMRKGVHGTIRPRLLLSGGVGYNKRSDVRKRKRVCGEVISEDIVQINTKVITSGKKDIEELLGKGPANEGAEAGEPKEEKKPKEKKVSDSKQKQKSEK